MPIKLQHRVPGIPCYIEYEIEPTDDFVEQFTALKQEHWDEILAPIDVYIGESALAHIEEARTIRRKRKAKHVDIYKERLQKLIDKEVNRGMAIIAVNDRVEVRLASGYSIVNQQSFEAAMARLIRKAIGENVGDVRYKRRQCRHWADSCAFEIAQAFFGRRLPE